MAQLGKMFAATRRANELPVVALNVAAGLLDAAKVLDAAGAAPAIADRLRLYAAELTTATKRAPDPAALAPLRKAALEAHTEISDFRSDFLDNNCLSDESGAPDPVTLAPEDRVELDRLDALLARLDAALKASGGAA